jgi:hypothetical protein
VLDDRNALQLIAMTYRFDHEFALDDPGASLHAGRVASRSGQERARLVPGVRRRTMRLVSPRRDLTRRLFLDYGFVASAGCRGAL